MLKTNQQALRKLIERAEIHCEGSIGCGASSVD